jgi:hypothetical protein
VRKVQRLLRAEQEKRNAAADEVCLHNVACAYSVLLRVSAAQERDVDDLKNSFSSLSSELNDSMEEAAEDMRMLSVRLQRICELNGARLTTCCFQLSEYEISSKRFEMNIFEVMPNVLTSLFNLLRCSVPQKPADPLLVNMMASGFINLRNLYTDCTADANRTSHANCTSQEARIWLRRGAEGITRGVGGSAFHRSTM